MIFSRCCKLESDVRPAIRLSWLCIAAAVLLLLTACPAARGVCTAPPDLQVRIGPEASAETYSSLGIWFADRKHFDCAADAFNSAFRLQPESARLAYLWGLSLYSAGHDAAALDPLHEAEQLDPKDINPHVIRGQALERMKRVEDAESEWRMALAIDPNSTVALDNLSQDLTAQKDYSSVVALLERPGNAEHTSAEQCLNLGVALTGTGRFEDAAGLLRKSVETYPDSTQIADELAVVLMLLARVQDAYAVLDAALAKHPDDQPTQLLYLKILVARNSDKAQALGEKLLTAYPNHWEVLYLNGLLELHEGDFAAARKHLERSIALNAAYDQSHAALGNLLAQTGDLPGAKSNLEKAIALGDNEPEVEYDLARVFERLGDKAQAQEKLRIYQQQKKAQLDKTQAAGKVESGDQAMAGGNTAGAISLYREALESDAGDPLILYKLAMALDKAKDIDAEKTALKQAIQLKPDLAEAQNQMGYLAVQAGDAAAAEGYFRAAVKASPSYAVAWVNLAAVLTGEEKWDDARQALNQALQLDPNNRAARRLDQVLAQGRPH